jgi:hypothetical protein
LNCGDRAEQLNGLLERGDLLGDHLGQAGDLLIEEIDVGEDRSDPQCVHAVKAATQRVLERGDLLTQPSAREIGQHCGDGRALDERVEDRAARHAKDV